MVETTYLFDTFIFALFLTVVDQLDVLLVAPR
jgi:hypothetical protein